MAFLYLRNQENYKDVIAYDYTNNAFRSFFKTPDKICGSFQRIDNTICALSCPKLYGFPEIDDFFLIGNERYFIEDLSISASNKKVKDNLNCFTLIKDKRVLHKINYEPIMHMDSLGYILDDSEGVLYDIAYRLTNRRKAKGH